MLLSSPLCFLRIWWMLIHKSQIRFFRSGKDIPHLWMWPFYPMVLWRDWYGRGREWGSKGSQSTAVFISWFVLSIREVNLRDFLRKFSKLLVSSIRESQVMGGSDKKNPESLRSKKMTGRRPTSLGHLDQASTKSILETRHLKHSS